MPLSEKAKAEVLEWYSRYCIENGKDRVKLLASNIAIAATERMQGKLDNVRANLTDTTSCLKWANDRMDKLEAENAVLREELERWKNPPMVTGDGR